MGTNPSHFLGDENLPVDHVSREAALGYCTALTQQERAAGRIPANSTYRLPTEAEWEYACRADTTTRFSYGDDPDYSQLGDYAWFDANSDRKTHPVGQKLPNPWGLYDMHGNVWEWCLDWWDWSLTGGLALNPVGPDWGLDWVIRGGDWSLGPDYSRSASRYGSSNPVNSGPGIGFRVVLDPGQ
jgi:formylglycine-generating enzyme required for sulfatase activity